MHHQKPQLSNDSKSNKSPDTQKKMNGDPERKSVMVDTTKTVHKVYFKWVRKEFLNNKTKTTSILLLKYRTVCVAQQ